ncbi:hypothetical protein [uncultured Clostridium sp.]|jgi:hypothetical protein|uniref:hypothetical protein n=1 Tax=uncultured Clostridium sp. TaxID=59620 RepID=UPI0025CDD3FF|nr:hypothetical protein [uncultured Clostridium sp.]
MSAEYLGQVANLVTCEELIELTNFTGGSSNSTGDITWGKILENGKIYLVSQALPKRNISWSTLNSQGLIFGKTITIGKDKYICRSMTGLNDDNSYGGEWSRWVIDLLIPQGMNFSNLAGRYRFTQDILDEKAVLVGYYNNSSTYTTLNINDSSTNYSWSPVLELLPRCEFSINSEDLGKIFNPVCIKYVVLGDTHTLIEKINGTQIRTLDNQVSGTEYVLDLTSQWDNIKYGKHKIEIIAIDNSNGIQSTITITFDKIKEITKPIPTTSSLKEFVDHIENIDRDINYLNIKLANNLKEKEIECNDSERITDLIDKIENIDFVNFDYGYSFLIDSTTFSTPLSTSYNLSNATYYKFNIFDILRDKISTYTLSLKLAHSTVNSTNFTFTICDSSQNVLHEISIPTFKYEFSIDIDLDYMPSDNKLGFFMYNVNTSTGLNTNCSLSCDIKIT